MINKAQTVPEVSTIDAPAATTNGDNYILAWTTKDQSIWWTTCPASTNQNSYDWVKEKQISNAASSGGPALANLNGKVWMACKGKGTDSRIFLSSLSGSTWSTPAPVPGIGTSAAPALTVTSKELFLVWKGEHDNTLYWSKSSDGKTWSAQATMAGAASSDTPALAGFKGVVYLACKGASDNRIWFAQYTDAKGWGKAEALTSKDWESMPLSPFVTSNGPALGVGDTGHVHVVWKGAHDNFMYEYVCGPDGAWLTNAIIGTVRTSARPALTTQTSAATTVLLAFKGGSSTDLWVAPLNNLPRIIAYPFGPLTWASPSPFPPPPPTGTGIRFGGGLSQAAIAVSLDLEPDGTATYKGWYQDQGTMPVFPAPAQNYSAAYVVTAANKVAYTFSHSANDVPTGGAIDQWNNAQKSDAIANNYVNLAGKARGYFSCTNTTDLGSLLDGLIADIKELVGWVEDAVQVVTVIADALG